MLLRTFLILLAATGIAAATDGHTFQWTGKLAPGQLIEIKGVNGNIHAEATAGREVEVIAEKTSRHSDPSEIRFKVVDNGNGTTICAVYPSKDGRPNECRPGEDGHMNTKNNDVKVEFTVRVPNGVRFTGRTVNGGIQAEHLGADVEARTVNGKIELSTTAAAVAETVNGSIHATLGAPAWNGARRFETVNGSVEVSLPPDSAADLTASTVNGRISTDFPVTVRGHFGHRTLHGSLGSAVASGRELRMNTVNGSIVLHQIGGPTI
jgi:DUF4097 and DUF4098 domain-containing protein YvlB